MLNKAISLVVPVYNEARIIEKTILNFIKCLQDFTNDFEIIVVDDGSDDGTLDILNKAFLDDKNIKLLRNIENKGSGASLWLGIKAATKELILTNFADSPFNLQDLKNILPFFSDKSVDFVVVARKNRNANSLYRKVTSYANFLLIKLLFNIKLADFQFVQIYKKEIIENIEVQSKGTFVPPEIIMELIAKGHKFRQVRCDFYKRQGGTSKCGRPKIILETIREMLRYWVKHNFCRMNIGLNNTKRS